MAAASVGMVAVGVAAASRVEEERPGLEEVAEVLGAWVQEAEAAEVARPIDPAEWCLSAGA